DPYSQAAILGLYDPDRSQALSFEGEIRSWGGFLSSMREVLQQQQSKRGAGLRILTESISSPTLADQMRGILAALPDAKLHTWEPVAAHGARAGAVLAFGQQVNTYYDFSKADVIVSLDCNFLAAGPGFLRYARQFAAKRRVRGSETNMNRLYVLEPMPTPTGAKADHRMPARVEEIEQFAWELAAAVGVAGGNGPKSKNPNFYNWIGPLARDLQAHKGKSVVLAGPQQSAAVHALAHAMNSALGNVGQTVFYTDPV